MPDFARTDPVFVSCLFTVFCCSGCDFSFSQNGKSFLIWDSLSFHRRKLNKGNDEQKKSGATQVPDFFEEGVILIMFPFRVFCMQQMM